ncbi:MAG: hypothetical protein WC828_02155 [Thermoleophilia bacterium]
MSPFPASLSTAKTGTSTGNSTACDASAPSIIPPVSGKPMLVEFYRDT